MLKYDTFWTNDKKDFDYFFEFRIQLFDRLKTCESKCV